VAGYLEFTTGQVLTAAQVNDFLMEQAVMTFANATARTAALAGVLREGILTYNLDTNALERYDGTAFVKVPDAADVDAAGGLVAVKQVVKTDVQSSSLAGSARTAISGLTIDHAVADAANKVVLMAQVSGSSSQSANVQIAAAITAGGTELNLGDAASTRTLVAGNQIAVSGERMNNLVLLAVHTPGITSSITYGVNIINVDSATRTTFVNRSEIDGTEAFYSRGSTVLLLMEVKV
jgi:hypothetical protein